MGADFWLSATKDTSPLCLQLVAGFQNIIHLITHMMDATRWIFLKKTGYRGGLTKRKKEFDFCIWQSDEDDSYSVVRFILWRIALQ